MYRRVASPINSHRTLGWLHQKKTFYFNTEQQLRNETFLNMFIIPENPQTDRFLLFFGKNKMIVLRHVRGSLSLQNVMYLPLYYADNTVDEQENYYEFVVND